MAVARRRARRFERAVDHLHREVRRARCAVATGRGAIRDRTAAFLVGDVGSHRTPRLVRGAYDEGVAVISDARDREHQGRIGAPCDRELARVRRIAAGTAGERRLVDARVVKERWHHQ